MRQARRAGEAEDYGLHGEPGQYSTSQQDSDDGGSVLDAVGRVCRCNMTSASFSGKKSPCPGLAASGLSPNPSACLPLPSQLSCCKCPRRRERPSPGGFWFHDGGVIPSCIHPDGHWLLYRVHSLFVYPDLSSQVLEPVLAAVWCVWSLFRGMTRRAQTRRALIRVEHAPRTKCMAKLGDPSVSLRYLFLHTFKQHTCLTSPVLCTVPMLPLPFAAAIGALW